MSKLLNKEQKEYIVNNYANQTNKELLENLKSMGYVGGMTTIRNFRYEHNLKKPKEGCFIKGNPWRVYGRTKDKFPEQYEHLKTDGFQKGHIPHNKKPIGTVYKWKTDYHNRYKKIRTEKGLADYHRYVWEQANGKIPDGYCIKFLDNNPKNCELSNLTLCKKETMIRAMRIGFTEYKDLNKELLKVAELKGAIKNVTNKNRKQHRRNGQ